MTKVLQISLPRSRSTVIYDLIKGYQQSLGLNEVEGHPELFLEFGRNMEIHDIKSNQKYMSEMYPVIKNNIISMHYVYPYILGDTKSRNLYKLNLLKQQKNIGIEYQIKGTLNLANCVEEVMNFFNDRKIIITTRRNLLDAEMSFYFAWTIKLFHARKNNIERYTELLEKGVVVDPNLVSEYKPFLSQLNIIIDYLKENNYNYEILYYEDLDNRENIITSINNVLKTDAWINYTNWEKLPIYKEKDYSKIIHNYEEIKELSINYKND